MALKKPATATPREDPQQYVLKKNYKKAVELYRAMVKAAPDDANLLLRLADCLVLDNQVRPAVEEYKRAAKVYADQGFLLKAIGVNKKIVKLDPSQEEVHESLSKLYADRGLLAGPGGASGSVPSLGSGVSAVSSGSFQFDMEAAPEGGVDLDLGLGVSDLGSADAGASAAAAEGDAAAARPGLDDLPDELSVDALSDALQAVPSDVDAASVAAAAVAGDSADDFAAADLDAASLADAVGIDLAPDAAAEGGAGGLDLAPDAPDVGALGGQRFDKVPLFSDFTPEELVEVIKRMRHETYAKDAVIVREGDPGDALFVIVTGSVRVVTSSRGQELQLATLGEGDFFGEGSLITGKPRTATILAEEESELLTLTKGELDAIVANHPRVRDVMMQFYQQRAENTVRSILRSSKK